MTRLGVSIFQELGLIYIMGSLVISYESFDLILMGEIMSRLNQRRYAPLPSFLDQDDGTSWTRIMLLQPGVSTAPIIVKTRVENIEACEPYEALSYVWGKANTVDRLIRDGAPMQIHQNLDVALRSIRFPDKARRLWVDAICIDQQNLDERANQVMIMRRIYERAARVVVWLGPHSPGVEEAFSLASQLAELRATIALHAAQDDPPVDDGARLSSAARIVSWLGSYSPGVKEAFTLASHLAELRSTVSLHATRDGTPRNNGRELSRTLVNDYIDPELPAWDHLAALFQREWWNRSWCVQEVVASSDCLARCEDIEMPMHDLLAASAFMRQRQEHIFSGSTLEFWDVVFQAKFQSERTSTTPGSIGGLLHLLASTREFGASDPRDKVFAFYGIADEGLAAEHARNSAVPNDDAGAPESLGGVISSWFGGVKAFLGIRNPEIVFDYSLSVVDVYRDAALFVIFNDRGRGLDLLSHVHHTRDVDEPLHGQCPTWVPRWFEPRALTPIGCDSWFAAGMMDLNYRKVKVRHDQNTKAFHRASSNLSSLEFLQRKYDIDHPPVRDSKSGDVLSRDGYRVDTVAKVTDIITADIKDRLAVKSLYHELFDTQLDSYETRAARYKDNSPLLNAFGVTLTACGYNRKNLSSRNKREELLVPVQTDFEAFMHAKYISDVEEGNHARVHSPEASFGDPSRFEDLAKRVCYNRRLYVTESGYLGLGPKFLQPGDVICVLQGGKIPFALRQRTGRWALVGEAYLNDLGILTGSTAWEASELEFASRIETFDIV
jgi:hypothetical protein